MQHCPTSVSKWKPQCFKTYSSACRSYNIRVAIRTGPDGPARKLAQIMSNYVGEAWKLNPQTRSSPARGPHRLARGPHKLKLLHMHLCAVVAE